MTYEKRPGSTPASPDIDLGLPEVCYKCDRDCPEPCEAFKRLEAVKTFKKEVENNYLLVLSPRVPYILKRINEILKGEK